VYFVLRRARHAGLMLALSDPASSVRGVSCVHGNTVSALCSVWLQEGQHGPRVAALCAHKLRPGMSACPHIARCRTWTRLRRMWAGCLRCVDAAPMSPSMWAATSPWCARARRPQGGTGGMGLATRRLRGQGGFACDCAYVCCVCVACMKSSRVTDRAHVLACAQSPHAQEHPFLIHRTHGSAVAFSPQPPPRQGSAEVMASTPACAHLLLCCCYPPPTHTPRPSPSSPSPDLQPPPPPFRRHTPLLLLLLVGAAAGTQVVEDGHPPACAGVVTARAPPLEPLP